MADNKDNIEDKLQDLDFEDIQPWNGERDTGYDVRMKWYRNFKRIRLMGYRLIDYVNTRAKDLMISLNDVFLSKKNDDTAEGLISFLKGAKFGKFAPGLTGYGGYIDGKGQAELESLFLRTELIVPTITYNKVKYIGGEQWQSKGEGTIESVDEGNNTLHLKLEDGERPMLAVGDLCKTIYKDEHGVRTAFFKITEVNDDGTVKYELKPGTAVHPTPNSNIAQFGNETDPSRQSSKYSTTTYTRYLTGVNGWEINESNIAMQLGDLSNLTINGESMAGYSAYLSNIYLSGIIKQIAPTIREEVEKAMPRFLGHWRTGLHVPFGCSVKMGRYVFTCKVKEGTDNPPMWTYVTDKGERIYFDEDADGRYYVITGDFNRNEYDITSVDGVDGSDGKDGVDGKDAKPAKISEAKTWLLWDATKDEYVDSGLSVVGDDGHSPYIKGNTWWEWDAEKKAYHDTGIVAKAESTYTWIAYSDFSDGRNLTFIPTDTTQYIGIAVNNKGLTQSKNPKDYQWIKTRGKDGSKGKDGVNGTSVTFMGHWRTGMIVPYLGITRMGGHSFICTMPQGTDKPPMWTYITDKGERIYFDEDEHGRYYVITGDYNDEYEILTNDGRDGSDGKDGEKGEPGPMTSVPIEWSEEGEYLGGEKFASVVFTKKNGSYQYYRARKDVPANTPVSNTEYWEPISSMTRVGIYEAFINHLFTDEAFISILQTKIFTSQSIQTTLDNGAYVLIERGQAKFFGKTSSMQIGIDEYGKSVLSYYNDKGVKQWDLGEKGIIQNANNKERWLELAYAYVSTSKRDLFSKLPNYQFERYTAEEEDFIREYHSSTTEGIVDNPDKDLLIYEGKSGMNIARDGYYIQVRTGFFDFPRIYDFDKSNPQRPTDMWPENPSINMGRNDTVYMQEIYRIVNGRIKEKSNYYYNK